MKIKKSLDTMSMACETNARPKFMTHIKKNSNCSDLKNRLINVKPAMVQQNTIVDANGANLFTKNVTMNVEKIIDDETTHAYMMSHKV